VFRCGIGEGTGISRCAREGEREGGRRGEAGYLYRARTDEDRRRFPWTPAINSNGLAAQSGVRGWGKWRGGAGEKGGESGRRLLAREDWGKGDVGAVSCRSN
jgi:hypothetical protein